MDVARFRVFPLESGGIPSKRSLSMRFATALLAMVAVLALAGCKQSSTTEQSSTTTTTSAASGTSATPGATTTGGATSEPADKAPSATSGATEGQERTLPGGLKVTDVKVGSGPMAESGSTVAVHYTGWLMDGTKFDSSLDRGSPIVFQLGAGRVIKGWEEGIKGMRVGGKRKLTIPSSMGYGAQGYPPVIPPDATLQFDVELMDVK
jgi:FKBP-type peptidyl-prolyl cis-trans isomerase